MDFLFAPTFFGHVFSALQCLVMQVTVKDCTLGKKTSVKADRLSMD